MANILRVIHSLENIKNKYGSNIEVCVLGEKHLELERAEFIFVATAKKNGSKFEMTGDVEIDGEDGNPKVAVITTED